MKKKKPQTIEERLDEYIEYAEKTKRFVDVGFYEEVKKEFYERGNKLRKRLLSKFNVESEYGHYSLDINLITEIVNTVFGEEK